MTNEELWNRIVELEDQLQPNLAWDKGQEIIREIWGLKKQTTDKRLPSEWERYTGVTVVDPDGWDRSNFDVSWNTPIDYNEWSDRSSKSTCDLRKFMERTLF